jgi:hypothetical protein
MGPGASKETRPSQGVAHRSPGNECPSPEATRAKDGHPGEPMVSGVQPRAQRRTNRTAQIGERRARFGQVESCRHRKRLYRANKVTVTRNPRELRGRTDQSLATRIAGCFPLGSPLPLLEGNRSMLPGSPASFPGWNRHLEAAFHSPETTARFRATISRSKLPTCFFDTLPFVRPARSDPDSLTRSGSPRYAPDHYRNPVA